MVPWKNNPRNNGAGKMVPGKFYFTYKNITVIFASKYRRILLTENGFVLEFRIFIDYVKLT